MDRPSVIRAAILAALSMILLAWPAGASATPVASAHLASLLGKDFHADTINGGEAAPDGQHILFRIRDSHLSGGTQVPTNDIYVVRADGTQLTRLTDSTQSATGMPITYALGDW